jgi:hypothetical protein
MARSPDRDHHGEITTLVGDQAQGLGSLYGSAQHETRARFVGRALNVDPASRHWIRKWGDGRQSLTLPAVSSFDEPAVSVVPYSH